MPGPLKSCGAPGKKPDQPVFMLKPRRRRLPAGIWPVANAGKNWLGAPLVLALAAALIAALVMPQQSPFPYRFEKNNTWNYPVLQAPFDFEVLRPEEEVRDQLEKVHNEHAPYYRVDLDLARQQKKQLQSFIEERNRVSRNDSQYEDLVQNPGRYQSYGQQLLDRLYSKGISGPELEALQKEDPEAPIYLVRNGSEQRTQARTVLSLSAARGFLIDTLPYSALRQPELLLPVLETALTANVFYDDSLTKARKGQKIAAVRSTGISVRKGEIVVQKGDLITGVVYQKLNSLDQRYETPKGFARVSGYFLLAVIAFGLFFFWLKKDHAELWKDREALLLAPVLVLLLLLLQNLTHWIGPSVVLLLPLWGLPLLLRNLGVSISWAAWAVLLLLSTISTDWSAGWLAIQMSGAAALYFFAVDQRRGLRRMVAVLLTAGVQVFVWWASGLAGNIPSILQSANSVLFIVAANGILLMVLPLFRKESFKT